MHIADDILRKLLASLEETTWGVTLRKIDGERFVILPAGSLDYPQGPNRFPVPHVWMGCEQRVDGNRPPTRPVGRRN